MIQINTALLQTLGIQLNDSEQAAFIEHTQEELEERIGLAVMDLLDDDEVADLITLQESGDSEGVRAWIERTIPDLKQLIQDEFNLLMGEIAAHA